MSCSPNSDSRDSYENISELEAKSGGFCSGKELASQLGFQVATSFDGILVRDTRRGCSEISPEAGEMWCATRAAQAGLDALEYVNTGSECGCACPEVEVANPFPPRQCAVDLEAQYEAAQDQLGDQFYYLDAGIIAFGPQGCAGQERIGPCDFVGLHVDAELEYIEWEQDGATYCGCACTGCVVDEDPKVDILFVVDNSATMQQEQMALVVSARDLLRGIATGDVDGDGIQDFERIPDVHAGVVTTEMGVGGDLPAFFCFGDGDDGILRSNGTVESVPELGALCTTTSCACDSVQTYIDLDSPADAELDAATVDLACSIRQGTTGCTFEQPLEAMLKAVTPSSGINGDGSPDFLSGVGQADGPNAGFLRNDAYLLVVALTDEDDCSGVPELFGSPIVPARCLQDWTDNSHAEFFHPLARYVDSLLTLRHPHRVGFLAIAGVPYGGTDTAFTQILGDSSMQHGPSITYACSNASGRAQPARRVVRTAAMMADGGAYAEVASICSDDYTEAVRNARDAIAFALTCEGECGPGLTQCESGCVDLDSDASNCGDCGTVCSAGLDCVDGACAHFD